MGLHGFKSGVGYGRSDDLSFTEMRVSGEDAKLLLRYPRAAGTNRASIRDGRFSEVTLGYMWPDLTPKSVAPEHRLHQRIELEGFKFNKREEFNISVKSRHFIPNAIHNLACLYAADGTLLDAKYYGLFAVDTRPKRSSSGGTRKIDGTYGNLNALKPVPLNEADRFYYLSDNPQENAAISCGRLSCDAIFGWQASKYGSFLMFGTYLIGSRILILQEYCLTKPNKAMSLLKMTLYKFALKRAPSWMG